MALSPTVLVTGSAGRLGRATVAALQQHGCPVRGLDLVPTPHIPDSLVGPLTDTALLRRALSGVGTVVHLAATPDDADFLTELLPNNIVGVYHLFEEARQAGVGRLVLASSGQIVWGQRFTGPLPIAVETPLTPRYWYAATKAFLEAAGRAYADKHGMSVIISRLGWCPRTREHVQELETTDWGPDVYLSPGDAGRFFVQAVTAPDDVRFAIVYTTSRHVKQATYDLEPARRLLGYEPRDQWPQGVEEMRGKMV